MTAALPLKSHHHGLGLSLVLFLSLGLGGCAPLLLAGAGAGVSVATDRRDAGTMLQDQDIELTAQTKIHEQHPKQADVGVVSFNHRVLLAGQVTSPEVRQDAEKITLATKHVGIVHNELVVNNPLHPSTSLGDAAITTRVKARMYDAAQFNAGHIKVYTEDGVVYLMGLVKKTEADAAAEIARNTRGVGKVVTLFEYLD